MPPVNSVCRRAITRCATTRNRSSANRSQAPSCGSPHANGGTSFGGIMLPNTFAPAPRMHPVVSRVPMPVFTWSPIRLPRNCMPVSRSPCDVRRVTVPYEFLRLLVMVPAPRFAQRPSTEWPTNPSCPLLACPMKITELSSPFTFERSPMLHDAMRPPATVTSSPMIHGPTSRVNACTTAPRLMSTGPCVASTMTIGSTAASASTCTGCSPSTVSVSGACTPSAGISATASDASIVLR